MTHGGHASLSAAGSSASALGPSSVRSTGVDVPVGAWKRIEPSSSCHVYTETPGPTSILVTSESTPLQIFSRFFTDEVWELLVLETNCFAASVCGTTPRARPWIDVSQQEMRAFFGELIYMGVCRLPRLGLYWTTKFPLAIHGVADVMSINDFQQLFRCLHLADNSAQIPVGQPGHDRLFKVRGLLDLLIPKFGSEYHIHHECTIDEAMIPFKGRLAFKQYMKAKPTKWGIKVFVLADATNGYIRTFQIYTGKSLEDGNSSAGLCTKVVLDLMSGFEGSGLHLYTDNYYTSPSLYLHLYNRGINACGTARPNRIGFPKELLTKATNSNHGFVDFLSNGPLLATIWVDKRSIYFLSTIHVAEPPLGSTCSVKRRTTIGAQEDKPCPPCLPDYQCFMRRVDCKDQIQQYYNLGRRSIKYYNLGRRSIKYYNLGRRSIKYYNLGRRSIKYYNLGRRSIKYYNLGRRSIKYNLGRRSIKYYNLGRRSIKYYNLGRRSIKYYNLGRRSIKYYNLGRRSIKYYNLGRRSIKYYNLGRRSIKYYNLGRRSIKYYNQSRET